MSKTFARKHRIAILGGGPGGYEAALAGAQLGAEVTLVERDGVGGSAVLTDVVPSKSLIATADAVNSVREAGTLGVQAFVPGGDGKPVKPEIAINFSTINKRILSMAAAQSVDMHDALKKAGVKIVQGVGRIDGPGTVAVSTADGDSGTDFDHFDVDTIVVAVGASPRELPSAMPDGERILTWKQLYNLKTLPEHLIVVGSGVTGAEFASAYRILGSKVTLVSSRDHVLPGEDPDAADLIERVFERNGMQVLSKSRADSVERTEKGVSVTLSDGRVVEGSHCLMAVGSIPNTQNIGLETVGIETTESGHIVVNRVASTNLPSVYAVGDCTNFYPLASVAAMQGRTAIMHALGDFVRPIELENVAANIFTSPEIATVGISQADIDELDEARRSEVNVQMIPLHTNPRAKMQGFTEGFIKIFAAKRTGRVRGAVVVAPRASELIFPLALAVEHRIDVDQIASAFSVYPSLTGSIGDAARALHVR